MKLGQQVKEILEVDDDHYRLRIRFADGKVRDVSLGAWFNAPRGLASEVLRGGMFKRCFVEDGAVAWPNGLELCPDTLMQNATKVSARRRIA